MDPEIHPDIDDEVLNASGDVSRKACEEYKPRLRRVLPELSSFTIYLFVTLFLTWPVIIKLNSVAFGKPSDNLGTLWLNWWFRSAGSLGFKASFCPLVGFPFGTRISTMPLEFVGHYTDRFLLLFTNEVVVLNIGILLSFFLSGITMYYLVRHLVRDRRVAFFAGFAYLIGIYHFSAATVWPGLAVTQWMPLFILALLLFMEKPTWKTGIGLALAEILVAGTSIHYGFFMVLFTMAFLPGYYFHGVWTRKKKGTDAVPPVGAPRYLNARTLSASLLAILIVAAVLMPVLIVNLGTAQEGKWPTSPSGSAIRNTEVSRQTAARPVDYISPRVSGTYLERSIAKVFGQSHSKINTWVGGDVMHSVYLGWTIIILAVLGMVFFKHRIWTIELGDEEADRNGFAAGDAEVKHYRLRSRSAVWGFFIAAVVCFILSLPPYVNLGSIRISLPSMAIRFLVPWFRFPYRVGVVVVICSIVLASYGLCWILSKLGRRASVVVIVISIILLAFEMVVVPPFRYFETGPEPQLDKILDALPSESALAMYPMSDPGGDLSYLYAQRWFKKPMINGTSEGSDGEALRRTVNNPFIPQTPSVLKRFGIDFLVYYSKMFAERATQPGSIKMTDAGTQYLPSGLEEVARAKSKDAIGDAIVYRITAPAARLVPLYLGDFTAPQLDTGRVTVRLSGGQGLIRIENYSGGDVRADIVIPVTNLLYFHEVEIVDHSRTLWKGQLSNNQQTNIELREVLVPEEGLDLSFISKGQKGRLSPEESLLMGIPEAAVKISDIQIDEKR